MYVRDCMTLTPLTVRPESDPMAALMVLKYHGFRHLPVLDKNGGLVGIVDRDDLEKFLSTAGAPTVLKRQHRVEQVMTRDVVTVTPDCPLEEAAILMVNHKIGSLPVMDSGGLVGIITKTDIFKQFAAVLGGATDSFRLTVQVADTPGQLAQLASRIAQVNGNISSLVAYPADKPKRQNLTLRVEGIDRQTVLEAVSGQAGLEVIDAWGCEET
jgi:acetoin utilization protein AcuB